jgi:isopenicillin N synthase-like dioxygenase
MLDVPKLVYDDLLTPRGSSELLDMMTQLGFVEVQGVIPKELDDRALAAAEVLFQLPSSQKQDVRSETFLQKGFSPFGQTRALDTGIPNLLESWVVSQLGPEGIPPGLLDIWYLLAAYGRHLRLVGENALAALDHAWGANGSILAAMNREPSNVHFFHYPRALLGTIEGARRQSIHIDSSIITVLPRATQQGLVIYNSGDAADVVAARGSVLIISGTVLDFLTSGAVKGCLHTVDTPSSAESAQDRISATYFVDATPSANLSPITSGGLAAADAPRLDMKAFSEGYRRKISGQE